MARWSKLAEQYWVLPDTAGCSAEVFYSPRGGGRAEGFAWMARQYVSARGEGWKRVGDGEVEWTGGPARAAVRKAKQEAIAALRAVGCRVR